MNSIGILCSTSIISLPLIEVRIMNNTIYFLSCFPTKCNMTLCAPHLVTTTYFVNNSRTRWTIFSLLFKHLGCFYTIFITDVFSIFIITYRFHTSFTYKYLTYTTFPLCGKKSSTSIYRTTFHENSFFFCFFTFSFTIIKISSTIIFYFCIILSHISSYLRHYRFQFGYFCF